MKPLKFDRMDFKASYKRNWKGQETIFAHLVIRQIHNLILLLNKQQNQFKQFKIFISK